MTQRTKHPQSAVTIPDKIYFRIGEVGTLCDLPLYVLRFWETQFAQLRPLTVRSIRWYRREDIEMILHIKQLRYVEGFTVPGVQRLLRHPNVERPGYANLAHAAALASVPIKGSIVP